MSYAGNCAKRLKLERNQNKDYTLENICDWFYLDRPAIEFHDLKEIKIISYDELQAAKETVSECLKCMQYPEFVGINFDIFEYCVPSLMLGILDSGNAFFNVPADPLIHKEILISLHVKYIFMQHVTSNREVICQFNIHGQSLYLIKLGDVRENLVNSRMQYRFAYAIATSGSTGTPKVVKVPHLCISPNIVDLKRILGITKSDKVAQLTSFTFDPSIIEIFLSFSCAATLFMVSKPLRSEPNRLLEKIFHARVTLLQITPSLLFHMWSTESLKKTILDKNSHLRVLLLGGEPFPNTKLLLETSHSQNVTRIFNIYGITEVSCWSSINEVIKDVSADESYLGKPLSETIFQVRNKDNEAIVRGEGCLYIGSSSRICVVGNETEEDLNKPVFRDTGDVVLISDDNRIFYRGRRNNIVKRFGNKLNLRELERVVTELNFVRNCIALWDAENHKLYLCLSVIRPEKESSILKSDIMSHLKILPAIYKPDKIIIIEHFNFTSSGKICLTSLRRICKDSQSDVIDTNDLNANVDEIFENLWKQHIESKDAGFLMSGGTSVTALQILNATTQVFKMEFSELIGMLLKNASFDNCIKYIKSALISRDWSASRSRCIDVPFDDKLSQKVNTDKSVIKKASLSLDDFPISTNQDRSYQWYKCRGRTYGYINPEQSTGSVLANISGIEILATYNLQKCVDASPIVYCYSETELFATVGSHSGIICTVNLLESNSKSYEVKLPDRIEASVLVLANFRGIVGCYDGYIYCIHLQTGKVIWKFKTQDMVKCTAITCMQRNKIFVGSYDRHVYCLSAEDGNEIWKTKESQGGICATGCLHSQSNSVLFGTLDGSCLALQQSTGQVIWKHKLQDPIFATPVVLKIGHVLFCSVAGMLCCFDIEMNCQMWQYEIRGNVFSYPVIKAHEFANSEYLIFASHNKNLYCLEMPQKETEKKEPHLKSTLQLHSPIFATPWCEEEHAFVACTDGTLQVLDLSEGKLLASKQLPGETFSSPIVHNDLIVLGCRDNNLYVLKLLKLYKD